MNMKKNLLNITNLMKKEKNNIFIPFVNSSNGLIIEE